MANPFNLVEFLVPIPVLYVQELLSQTLELMKLTCSIRYPIISYYTAGQILWN
jgi:hypothetical protein